MEKNAFTDLLMQWHFTANYRKMPWKGEKNPYKVWLSEVILQQTRVEQGLEYFERFINHYPDITALAAANDEEVFKLWEGLGYYNRCKNLLITARIITTKYNGVFPTDYETILSLKGIGNYTAAAIASFCFNLAYPVIDGNVLRVLARVYALEAPIDGKGAKKIFTTYAEKLLYKPDPGAFNQAIMDFGATVCKPALPLCNNCALQTICKAYKTARVNILPLREKTLKRKKRWLSYFIFECGNQVLVSKRTGKDIWQNLFEFYLVETPENPQWDENLVKALIHDQLGVAGSAAITIAAAQRQQLTHQEISGYFIKANIAAVAPALKQPGLKWIPIAELQKLAFPRFIARYISQHYRQPNFFNC